ncbi:PP2C family protein-serine/threonine phosphatase [Borrelia sp. P9F1]|uniref:PP2C family protein-serine/threonine phosphatase n=1 Tax=Borrelia sp. P9F1 TaxID=3058374 RepID=UPI002648F55C|nr:SpoIIE family protein phosphatase [Borrelia sp. P9F1]WKC58074.1 SpoIIE family protein phosphatase [Borrelia sp. P9F1]
MNNANIVGILNEFNLKLENIFLLINTYSYELYKETPRYFYGDITNYLELTLEVSNKFKEELEASEGLRIGKFLIKSVRCDLVSYLYLSLELIDNSMNYGEVKDAGFAFLKAISFKISSIVSYVEIELERLILSSIHTKQVVNKDRHKILIFSGDKPYKKELTKYFMLKYDVISIDAVDAFNRILCSDFYDLIILDFLSDRDMSIILNLLRGIKKNSLYEKIPVIIVSNITRKDIVTIFVEERVDDYFLKSLDLLVLEARVSGFIEKEKSIEQGQKYLDLILKSRECLESELLEARNYVESLLPNKLQNEFFSTNWIFIPSERIGGDFFNYYFVSDDELVIYLIDISGHGVGSTLLSLSVASVINSYVMNNDAINPSKVLGYVNSYFVKFKSDMFITLWYGVLNVKTRHLRFAAAGAPPAIVITYGDNFCLHAKGMILGIEEVYSCQESEVLLNKNSHLLLFSDGVYEIENKKNLIMSIDDFYGVIKENTNHLDDFILMSIYRSMLDLSKYNKFRDDFSVLEFIIN